MKSGKAIFLLFLVACLLWPLIPSARGQVKSQDVNRPRRVNEEARKEPSVLPTIEQSKNIPGSSTQQPSNPNQPPQQPKNPQEPKKGADKNADPDPEPIRINSTLVAVPVSVTDQAGNPVRDLKAEDFALQEDGVSQQLQSLGEPGKTPLEMSLLFDVSRSIRNRFDFEREAAGRFLQQVLKPGDFISVYAIGSSPKLVFQRSGNAESAVSSTTAIQPTEDSTAFFDTVVKAGRYLSDNANPGTRRVMVVLSDGEDTSSERFRLGDAVTEMQRNENLFYAINPSGPSIRLNKISTAGHQGMVRLAAETGGVAFLPEKIEDLTQVFSQIAAELQAQYLLGYYSTNEKNDGQLRKIIVRVPKRSDLRIRARSGYFAPKE